MDLKKIPKYNDKIFDKKFEIFQNITKDSYAINSSDNSFNVFKSINNEILYLIYANDIFSIISYDLIENKKLNEIKNAHNTNITSFNHYPDNINKRDLIISISGYTNNIKLWNINNLEFLLNIENINSSGYLLSACFFNNNNLIYIISSNLLLKEGPNQIKIFDLNGKKIKEIEDNDYGAFFIDIYSDNKLSKNYIVTSNVNCVKSYNYDENQLYHKYNDNSKELYCHYNIKINEKVDIIEIIESCEDGHIRIWDFHYGYLLKIIKVSNEGLNTMYLWNNDYLFVCCNDKSIKLIDLKNGKIIKELIGHKKRVLTIKKINHFKFGECLISQGDYNDQIKMWIYNN